eukprot:3274370-Prymnesium_polylepis.1
MCAVWGALTPPRASGTVEGCECEGSQGTFWRNDFSRDESQVKLHGGTHGEALCAAQRSPV